MVAILVPTRTYAHRSVAKVLIKLIIEKKKIENNGAPWEQIGAIGVIRVIEALGALGALGALKPLKPLWTFLFLTGIFFVTREASK